MYELLGSFSQTRELRVDGFGRKLRLVMNAIKKRRMKRVCYACVERSDHDRLHLHNSCVLCWSPENRRRSFFVSSENLGLGPKLFYLCPISPDTLGLLPYRIEGPARLSLSKFRSLPPPGLFSCVDSRRVRPSSHLDSSTPGNVRRITHTVEKKPVEFRPGISIGSPASTVEKKPVEFRPSRSMFDRSLVIYGKFETSGYLSCPKQATGPNGVTLINQVTLRRLRVRVHPSSPSRSGLLAA